MSRNEIVKAFEGVLRSLATGAEYKQRPPQGPPEDLPALTDEELKSIKERTLWGEDLSQTGYAYHKIKLVEDPAPVEVQLPSVSDLQDFTVCAIDGSNQRVERSSFYFLLMRAALVEFRYSTSNKKPYFRRQVKDLSAVLWVDGNVFSEDVRIYTEELKANVDGNANVLDKILKIQEVQGQNYPFLVRHDPEKIDKSPSSHALGWAVKFQQALEMALIHQAPVSEGVCIKDGPLFSTSVSPEDTILGLNPIFTWDNQILIASSKRIKDSTLLLEALQRSVALRDYWFHGQNITDSTLRYIATDSILLPRILKPGYRTPLMEALPVARQRVVEIEERLMPLSCYYLSRHRPHTYIRIEVPKFMWERDPQQVKRAIQIVCWQHELGHKAPLAQLFAHKLCQLTYEKDLLEKRTLAALQERNLDFPEEY